MPEQLALDDNCVRMDLERFLQTLGISERRKDMFLIYHYENPDVWTQFERFALEVANAGRTKCATTLVRERIRWERTIVHKDEFKFNNNYTPIYGRWFEYVHEMPDFFEKRTLKRDTKTMDDYPGATP